MEIFRLQELEDLYYISSSAIGLISDTKFFCASTPLPTKEMK